MIDKTKFLADADDIRYYLREPMQIDGQTVYSNGHIILIEPSINDIESAPKHINIDKIATAIAKAEFLKPSWPELPEKQLCKECNGTGKETWIECPECEGNGYVTLENEFNTYQPDCETCYGRKRIKSRHAVDGSCTKCNGIGKAWLDKDHIRIDGVNIKPNYAELIMHEQSLEIAASTEIPALLFRCGDLSGAIMGMRLDWC